MSITWLISILGLIALIALVVPGLIAGTVLLIVFKNKKKRGNA